MVQTQKTVHVVLLASFEYFLYKSTLNASVSTPRECVHHLLIGNQALVDFSCFSTHPINQTVEPLHYFCSSGMNLPFPRRISNWLDLLVGQSGILLSILLRFYALENTIRWSQMFRSLRSVRSAQMLWCRWSLCRLFWHIYSVFLEEGLPKHVLHSFWIQNVVICFLLLHPAGTSEISELCGNISNFRLNVNLWQEGDIASFWENFFRNP